MIPHGRRTPHGCGAGRNCETQKLQDYVYTLYDRIRPAADYRFVVILLFGGAKIPELMRGMGRGVREFKDAMENPAAGDDKNGKEQAAPQESRKETPEEKK